MVVPHDFSVRQTYCSLVRLNVTSFIGSMVPALDAISTLGISVTANLMLKPDITQILKSALKELKVMFRCQRLLISKHYSDDTKVSFVFVWSLLLYLG